MAPCQDATQQPASANKGGGVEDGHVRRQRDKRWRKAEAARQEATQQPVGKQEAKGRRGASGQEETVSQKPAVPQDNKRQRLRSKMTREESSTS
jgi:hypothetical protein